MKFFSWMQSKFSGEVDKRANAVAAATTNHRKKEELISNLPHGLLTIGTLSNPSDPRYNQENRADRNPSEIENIYQEQQCSSPDFSEFTCEEVRRLGKELKKLLNKKQSLKSTEDQTIADLPLDRFLNCPSSLANRTNSNHYSNDKDEEEIERTIRIIIGRCKDVSEKKKKMIGKESLAFLIKKMFVCRSGFGPPHSFRDTNQESRMEKLMRSLLTKKIYSQNSYTASSSNKYLDNYSPKEKEEEEEEEEEEESHHKNRAAGSKWDKTDSEYIVLEI